MLRLVNLYYNDGEQNCRHSVYPSYDDAYVKNTIRREKFNAIGTTPK